MRVMAVIESTAGGGAETSLAAMAPGLISRGVELDVVYFHDRGGVKDALAAAGATLISVSGRGGRLRTIRRLRAVMAERTPELVHTMVYEADILGRVAGRSLRIPVVSSIINEMYGSEQQERVPSVTKLRLAQLADIATARAVTRFHAISHTVAGVMAPRLRIQLSDIVVVYRGRDPERFPLRTAEHRALVRGRLGLPAGSPLILAASRQEPQKALDVLIRSLPHVVRQYPDARCLIAGRSGGATNELAALIQELDLESNVNLLGHRHDVADLISAADVFVLPSLWEGLGGSVIEALFVGCPVVCSDLPVLREVLTSDNGTVLARLPAPGRAPEFAEAILACIDSPVGSGDLERRQHAMEHFGIDVVVDQMLDLYREMARRV